MSNYYQYGTAESQRECGYNAYGSEGINYNMGERRGYPPVHVPPAKPYPADPYIDQLPLPEALMAGTLFRWLYDPYQEGWQPPGKY